MPSLSLRSKAGKPAGTGSATASGQAVVAPEPDVESDNEEEDGPDAEGDGPAGTGEKKKRKRKKKSKMERFKELVAPVPFTKPKLAVTGPSKAELPDLKKELRSMGKEKIVAGFQKNPSLVRNLLGDKTLADDKLAERLENLSEREIHQRFEKLSPEEIIEGTTATSAEEVVRYMLKGDFWDGQPVGKRGGHKKVLEEGAAELIDVTLVPDTPMPLGEGFEWVTMDLTNDADLKETYELLKENYVEDGDGTFRFNYSASFLRWALLSPGWRKEWHVGVRETTGKSLVAFISAVPISLRVRQATINASEVNYLCVRKNLRLKHIAKKPKTESLNSEESKAQDSKAVEIDNKTPMESSTKRKGFQGGMTLIEEMVRRCYAVNTFQAVFTGGTAHVPPVSTCRYYHRTLDWEKLYSVGFVSRGEPGRKLAEPKFQVIKYTLPKTTSIKGLRAMEEKDVDDVLVLLKAYLGKFDIAPQFTREEVKHWFLHAPKTTPEQVVWAYVVEDPKTKKITDFVSFYQLSSTVLKKEEETLVNAAYLYYYAVPVSLRGPALKSRLNELMNDALILAKRYKFDVFNALTILDNNLFLEDQKFSEGDGLLHYMLYNYMAKDVAGGVKLVPVPESSSRPSQSLPGAKPKAPDTHWKIDKEGGSGVGLVML